jgi:hypothetical protein
MAVFTMNRHGGLGSHYTPAHLPESIHVGSPGPVGRLLAFVAALVMTVLFSGSVSNGDRAGAASVRAAELTPLHVVTATAPVPLAAGMSAPQLMEVGEGAAPQNVRATRRKTRCLECAVVDSVYRSYRPERAVGACLAATWASALAAVGADDRGAYGAVFALGAITAPVVAERPDSMPLAAVVNYQIVVRLADGSRVVFNEPTARTLQAGDRIVVIAGVPAAVL